MREFAGTTVQLKRLAWYHLYPQHMPFMSHSVITLGHRSQLGLRSLTHRVVAFPLQVPLKLLPLANVQEEGLSSCPDKWVPPIQACMWGV